MEQMEIERRFLIRMPEAALLASLPFSGIEQIYLLTPEGERERIRRRVFEGRTVYTHTVKTSLSKLSRIEREDEIDAREYDRLLRLSDPSRRPLYKTRYLYSFKEQLFEIDVFPFWDDRALMEIELRDEAQEVFLPDDIEIVREVTEDKRYTNSAIARVIPREKI